MMDNETNDFDHAISELVYDGFSVDQVARMARTSAEKAQAELDAIATRSMPSKSGESKSNAGQDPMNDVDESDFLLPDWASSRSVPGEIRVMQQLYTRDGSRTGNATVAASNAASAADGKGLYVVVTDANNVMILERSELDGLFTPGAFIITDFPNPGSENIDYEGLLELALGRDPR